MYQDAFCTDKTLSPTVAFKNISRYTHKMEYSAAIKIHFEDLYLLIWKDIHAISLS